MKILFTRFPLESRLGGAERQTISLMEGLLARGHAVAFAGSCPTLLSLCKDHNIPATPWHIGNPPVTAWSAFTFLFRRSGMRRSLARLLQQFGDVDAVCMLSLSEKLLLTDTAAGQGKNILWIEHDRIGRWLRSNPWLGLLKKQSAHATIVTVSQMSKVLMAQIGFDPARIVAIPNGVDAHRLGEGPRPPHDGLRIGCVARLTKDKGVAVLLEAVKRLPDAALTVVGDGPERDALRIPPNATILPRHNDLGSLYRDIDVFVLPSVDNDPFGMAAAEAMWCGTAVIVTDQCGIAGSLTDGVDVLMVRANDADALASALERLRDTELRGKIARNGAQAARERFSLDGMTDAYAALLR